MKRRTVIGGVAILTVAVLTAMFLAPRFAPRTLWGYKDTTQPPKIAPGQNGAAWLPSSTPLVGDATRWKAVAVTTPSGFDMGLGYEWARVKLKTGPLELPEITGDFILTPDRLGVGGSLALTDCLDLEAGVSRRHDTGGQESYVGVGMHFRF